MSKTNWMKLIHLSSKETFKYIYFDLCPQICVCMCRPDIFQCYSDYFWLCGSLFPLHCKFLATTDTHTHMHTHCPYIMPSYVSTQESLGWFVVIYPLGSLCDLQSSFNNLFFSSFFLFASLFPGFISSHHSLVIFFFSQPCRHLTLPSTQTWCLILSFIILSTFLLIFLLFLPCFESFF